MLGLNQVRPVPVVDKTAGRQPDWQAYYTPGIAEQARRDFGPFMHAWGYEFPAGWGAVSPSRAQLVWCYAVRGLARRYLIHVRYCHGLAAGWRDVYGQS